jgi:hypothetical protein
LAIFLSRVRSWSTDLQARRAAVAGIALILGAGTLNVVTSPLSEHQAAAYNVLFLTILPESKNPAADLRSFGLSPGLARYSGTNTWSANTGYYEPEIQRGLGRNLSLRTTTAFLLKHPARLWRHIGVLFSGTAMSGALAREPATPPTRSPATSLRPEFCGNFEQAARHPPGARSQALAVWSAFHERTLARLWRIILLLLPISLLAAGWLGIRWRGHRWSRWPDFAALLSGSCLIAFLTAALCDGLDNVKHMYLFNALLDVCLLWVVLVVAQACPRVWDKLHARKQWDHSLVVIPPACCWMPCHQRCRFPG